MKSSLDLLHTMSANAWFGSLPLPQRRAMLTACEPLHLRPGEMLFRQGDAVPPGSGAMYGLVSGTLKASTLSEDGKEAILAVIEPGSWFGENSLIDHQPRTHDATALTDVVLLALPHGAVAAAMKSSAFAQAMCRLLASRVRSLYAMVEDATLRSTRARVARRLALMARGNAQAAASGRVVVRVSQESFAMMLGITRQTLSKELKALARQGALVPGYGHIEIVSLPLLEALGA